MRALVYYMDLLNYESHMRGTKPESILDYVQLRHLAQEIE